MILWDFLVWYQYIAITTSSSLPPSDFVTPVGHEKVDREIGNGWIVVSPSYVWRRSVVVSR